LLFDTQIFLGQFIPSIEALPEKRGFASKLVCTQSGREVGTSSAFHGIKQTPRFSGLQGQFDFIKCK